jgi:SAM-dependent methyltransferase
LIRQILFQLWLLDGRRKLRHMLPYLAKNQSVIDVGCGAGSVTRLLRAQGHTVTPLDVRAQSLTPAVTPILFDGQHIPFGAQYFDVALLLTVLHHANEPEFLLTEAARVAKRIIVIEDTYSNRPQRALTLATDSLVNFEFRGHPHNNRSDIEWRACFAHLQLRVLHTASWPVAALFRQSLYVLDTSLINANGAAGTET